MAKQTYHLAQVNIARMLAPLDDPIMADFVAQLDEINALADSSVGFVWRLQGEGADATSLRPYEDNFIIVNMSVWRTPDDLKEYVYRSAHTDVMRRRREWFSKMADMYYVTWWVDAEHTPTVAEARERLDYLRQHGETEYAFSFKKIFAAPDTNSRAQETPAPLCPAWGV